MSFANRFNKGGFFEIDTVRDIIHDTEAVEDIKQGAVGFTVREYVSKNPKAKGKKCYTVNWVDIVDGTQVQAVDIVAEK